MARELADLFRPRRGPGVETIYGTVISADPLHVRPDSMESDDIGPLAFIRSRPAVDDRVMLMHSGATWVVLGPAGGDLVLVWNGADGSLRYSVRRGAAWTLQQTYTNPGGAIDRIGVVSPTDGGGGFAVPTFIGATQTFAPIGFQPINGAQMFKMTDGALVLPFKREVGDAAHAEFYAFLRSAAGVWSAAQNVTPTAFGREGTTWAQQIGDTVYMFNQDAGGQFAPNGHTLVAIAYVGGALTGAQQTFFTKGDQAENFIYDPVNDLFHTQISFDDPGSGLPSDRNLKMRAISRSTLTTAYEYVMNLPSFIQAVLLASLGGASLLNIRQDTGVVSVRRFTAGPSSYTEAMVDEGVMGLTSIARTIWDGAAATVVSAPNSTTFTVQQRTAPGVFGPIETISTPSRGSAASRLARVEGPRLRIYYRRGTASPFELYDDEIVLA